MKYNTHVPKGVGRERVWPLPPEKTTETIESGPLCIKDLFYLFQNKTVAFFKFIITLL